MAIKKKLYLKKIVITDIISEKITILYNKRKKLNLEYFLIVFFFLISLLLKIGSSYKSNIKRNICTEIII